MWMPSAVEIIVILIVFFPFLIGGFVAFYLIRKHRQNKK